MTSALWHGMQTGACWRTVRFLFLTAIPFKLCTDLSQFIGPFFLNRCALTLASPHHQGDVQCVLTVCDSPRGALTVRPGGL